MKTVSKCLARMKGCWDSEFERSVDEIMEHQLDTAILSVCFLWQAHTLGGISLFSQAHGRWRSHQGQPAHAAHPNMQ